MIKVITHTKPLDDLSDYVTVVTPSDKGVMLDGLQKKTAKDDAAAFAKGGDYEAALYKILELI